MTALILAAAALSILRSTGNTHLVTLSSDATGGILVAVDGSQPAIRWIAGPDLCSRSKAGDWRCTVHSDVRRFTAQATVDDALNGPVLEEARVWCQPNGGAACPQCMFPVAPATIPTAPRGLVGSCAPSAQVVELAWTAPVTGGHDAYIVEVSSNAGASYAQAARIDGELTAATVTGAGANLLPATNYYYRVRAIQGVDMTLPSNTVSITTGRSTVALPAAPTGLSAAIAGSCYPELDCGCR